MVLWASGSAMVIRRRLFEELKGFSPELFLYHDEIDLCSRAWLKGYIVVSIPFTKYKHLRGGVVDKTSWISWYFANRNRWLTTIRYMPLKNLILSLLLALPLEFTVNIVKSLKRTERLRAPLYTKILRFLIKEFHSNIRKRSLYYSRGYLTKFIIDVRSPLSKESEALTNALRRLTKFSWSSH